MALRFVIGRSGTGKSTFCMEEIARKQEAKEGRLIYIVPEQFSSQGEKDLVAKTGGKCLLDAEVLSFGRFAHGVLQEKGAREILGETGKSMVLRKVLQEKAGELSFFSGMVGKQGFIQILSLTITELFQYGITPEQLEILAQDTTKSKGLQEKLKDLKLLYQGYLDFLQQKYDTSDELLDLLQRNLVRRTEKENVEIWIDGFYGFTPQEYGVIGELLRLSKGVTVTLSMDAYHLQEKDLPVSAPFYEAHRTAKKLRALAQEKGIAIQPPVILEKNMRVQKESLGFLEKYYFSYGGETCLETEGISIFSGDTKQGEIKGAAEEIIRLVQQENLRFREIALVTNDLAGYQNGISSVLREYEIPFFLDAKEEILSHPLIGMIQGLFAMGNHFYSYESVMEYLKTGLSNLDMEQVDTLENYLLAYGIKGYRWELPEWSFGFSEKEEQEKENINRLREAVLFPIRDFLENVKGGKKRSTRTMAVALFQCLEGLSVAEKLEQWAEDAKKKGNLALARRHEKIWDLFIALLEKTVEIFGEEEMSSKDFAEILETGLLESTLGMIPPGADCVMVGDIERSRLPEIKALFVLGVNEGILPSPSEAQGIFSGQEREQLEGEGVELASGGKRHVFEEQYLIYRGLTKPSHFLFFGFAAGDLEGKALLPSRLIDKIQRLFPKLTIQTQENQVTLDNLGTEKIAFHSMGRLLRQKVAGEEVPAFWSELYGYFANQGAWKDRLAMLWQGILQEGQEDTLSGKMTKRLYGKTIQSSVSRLERFAACPFSYFVEYSLGAKPRKEFSVGIPDLGNLFHQVLDTFSKELQGEGRDWKTLTKEETEARVQNTVDILAPQLGNRVLMETAENQYLIKRLERISKRAVWTLVTHVQEGDFHLYSSEVGFGTEEGLPPIVFLLENGEKLVLRGKIDRVDVLDRNNKRYVKIIDYKSGNKEFQFRDIYYGLQLQLLLYMDAFLEKGMERGTEGIPGGVFYFRLQDPRIEATAEMTAQEIQDALLRSLKMSGLVLDDEDLIMALDHGFMGEDGTMTPARKSPIIPVSLGKNGAYHQGTNVATEEEYRRLMAFSGEKAKELAESMIKGNISKKPYRAGEKSPCNYCGYRGICCFDPEQGNGEYQELKKMKAEDFWAVIGTEK